MYISKSILSLLVLGIIILILYTCNAINPPSIQGSSEKVDTLTWVNDAGDIVSSLKGSPEAFNQLDHHTADSLVKVYKTTNKDLLEYIIALEHTNADLLADAGSKQVDYFPMDTSGKDCPPQLKNLRQTFSNPYYKASVQIGAPGGDSSFLHLEHFDTLTALWKTVSEGNFFHRKSYLQLDLSMASHKSDSANNQFYGLKAYRKLAPVKKWAIGLQVGYGFTIDGIKIKPAPYVGIGITKTLIRF